VVIVKRLTLGNQDMNGCEPRVSSATPPHLTTKNNHHKIAIHCVLCDLKRYMQKKGTLPWKYSFCPCAACEVGFYVSTCTQVFFPPPGHKLFIEQTGLCNGAPPKSFVSHYRHDNIDCSLSLSDYPSFCVLNRRLCPLPKPLKRAKIAEQHPIWSSCLYHELRNKNRRGCGRENKPRFGGFHTAYRQMYVSPCPSSFSPLLLLLLPPA